MDWDGTNGPLWSGFCFNDNFLTVVVIVLVVYTLITRIKSFMKKDLLT